MSLHLFVGINIFAEIDVKTAYQQIMTINTSIGLLKWTLMIYGIKAESAIFQGVKKKVLGDSIKNMAVYKDDICLGAITEELNS